MTTIEGTILPYSEPAHMTTVDGQHVVLELDGGEYSASVLDSFRRYVAAVRPPFLIQHTHDGLRRGEVVEVFRGDDPDTGVDSIRVRIRVDDPELNVSLIKRLSGYFIPDATDSRGETYRMGLGEVSAVSAGMVDATQGDVRIAASAWFSPGGLLTNVTSGGQSPVIAASVPQEMPMTKEELIALLADADVLAALKAALMPPPAPAPTVEVETSAPMPAPGSPAPTPPAAPMLASADLLKRFDALEAMIGQLRAPGQLAATIAAAGPIASGVKTGGPQKSRDEQIAEVRAKHIAAGMSFQNAHKAAIAAVHTEG